MIVLDTNVLSESLRPLPSVTVQRWPERGLERLPAGRILPFDTHAARAFARIAAGRDAIGRPFSRLDAMIAAITRSQGAALATRDAGGFAHCGFSVIDPSKD